MLNDTIDRLARELREAQDVIDSAYQSLKWSGVWYMDPPDGGNPTLGEMLGRMAEDAQRTVAAEAEVARLREALTQAENTLRGGPTLRDAHKGPAQRIHDAANICARAAQEVRDA